MNAILLPIQAILFIFLLFAVSRVFLRFREGVVSFGAFLFWMALWLMAGFAIVKPDFTTFIARQIGIQRGTDVVIYLSLVLLFYLIFRTNVMIENLHEEISRLVKEIALTEKKEKKEKD